MTAPNLNELRRLAQAATKGTWVARHHNPSGRYEKRIIETEPSDEDCAVPIASMWHDANEPDHLYIAAASPETVIALLDRIAALEAERDQANLRTEVLGELTEAATVPKHMLDASQEAFGEALSEHRSTVEELRAVTDQRDELAEALRTIAARRTIISEPTAWEDELLRVAEAALSRLALKPEDK